MSQRRGALGGESEVAPIRGVEVEHYGTGHLELGRTVVGLGVLGDEVLEDRGQFVLVTIAYAMVFGLRHAGQLAVEVLTRLFPSLQWEKVFRIA